MPQSQVLARKWRPKNFSTLIGQDHIAKALINALDKKRIHHAYLFTGTRGVGKTTIARILAKALNCISGITSKPCENCTACNEIDSGNFIDLVELDAASNTQVDNMRELLENAMYAPTFARYKIYIIDEVHMLSKSAFNAMLKTLEEPPDHIKFILATTDPQKIPVTVLSRCLQFNLKKIPSIQISAHLKCLLEKEKIPYSINSLQIIAHSAQGSIRDALSILDQAIIFSKGRIEESEVNAMLGIVDQTYLYELLEAIIHKNGIKLLNIADDIETKSLSFDYVLQEMARLLHTISIAQIIPKAINDNMHEYKKIILFSKRLSSEEVQLYYQIVLHGRSDLGLAPDEYAGFTMTLMRILAFTPQNLLEGTQATTPAPYEASIEENPQSGLQDKTSNSDIKVTSTTDNVMSPSIDPRNTTNHSNIDWPTLVNQLELKGMSKMLAQNCKIKNQSKDCLELCLLSEHKYLLEKNYQDKIQVALNKYFKKNINLEFSVGEIKGITPAELNIQKEQKKLQQAISSIETDPIIQNLVENFDAKLINSSIKPIKKGDLG